MATTTIDLIDKLASTNLTSLNDLELLLSINEDSAESYHLFKTANQVRKKYVGDEVFLRAIIEFSNYCRCHCHYCGLRSENSQIERYRMSADQIVSTAYMAIEAGYKSLVLQSGEDLGFKISDLVSVIEQIKNKYIQVAITISIGEREQEVYKAIKNAGADRFLIKHEIGNDELYKELHSGDLLSNRIDAIKRLFSLGFQTGGGLLIGLKGQTTSHIANDLLLCQSLNLNMVSIGPMIAHPQTPLANIPNGNLFMVRKAVALARLLQPKALIPSTSAYISLTGRPEDLLNGGANVLMQKAEEINFQKKYQIYPRQYSESSLNQNLQAVQNMLLKIGRIPSLSRGDFIA